MPFCEFQVVSRLYRKGEREFFALKEVTFAFAAGDFISVTGPSGSGKSTFLNILGLLDRPTCGTYLHLGEDVSGLDDDALSRIRNRTIGFIFQSFNLIPVLDVYENIEFPLLLQRSMSRKEREERVHHFIDAVGLSDRIKNKPNELSGGQRQRVAIARALVSRPIIVLADEPTANLDSETGHVIVEAMRKINETEKTTFIFSTHDDHIMEHARRVVAVRDGLVTGETVKG